MATLQEQIDSFAVRLAQEFNKLRTEVETLKNNILGAGVEEQYDTIKEVADFAKANKELIDSLVDNANTHVAYTEQYKSDDEKSVARNNISAASVNDLYTHNTDPNAHSELHDSINTVIDNARTEFNSKLQDTNSAANLAKNYSDNALLYKDAAESAKNAAQASATETNTLATEISNVVTSANVVRIDNIIDDGVVNLVTEDDLVGINNNIGNVATAVANEQSRAIEAEQSLASSIDTRVPDTRKINNKPLSSDITLTASDVGASESSHTHDYLPLSGGKMTGRIYADGYTFGNLDAGVRLKAGVWEQANTGAFIDLATDGHFEIKANDGTNRRALTGYNNGTLTWNGNTVLTTANGLPLSGGTMTGSFVTNGLDRINSGNNAGSLGIAGGSSREHGGSLLLFGESYGNGSLTGCAILRVVRSSDNATLDFKLSPTGSLTWNSKNVETIDSTGDTGSGGWIRYISGLQICWGNTSAADTYGDATISFAKNFLSDWYGFSAITLDTNGAAMLNNPRVMEHKKDFIKVKTCYTFGNGSSTYGSGHVMFYVAIGRWK